MPGGGGEMRDKGKKDGGKKAEEEGGEGWGKGKRRRKEREVSWIQKLI